MEAERAANGKSLFTETIAEEIIEAVRCGLTMEKAAELVGLEPKTVQNWVGKRRLFGERIKKARRQHEIGLLKSIQEAGEKSWQARAWLAERVHGYAVPSTRLQVSGNVEHGINSGLAAMLAGVASRRREKQAEVIECKEVKAIPDIQTGDNSYCATDGTQPIVTPTLSKLKKTAHVAMRRRKPRAESLAKYPPTTTTPPATPPSQPDTHKTPPSNCDSK